MKQILISLIAVSLFSLKSGSTITEIEYEGIARNIENSSFLYKELNRKVLVDKKHVATHTNFADQSNNVFASRTLDFSKSLTKPNYEFSDKRHGHYEKVEYSDNKFKITYRNSFDGSFEYAQLEVPEPAVIDGGFSYFINNNWNELISGKVLSFNFISVSRQDYYQFDVFISENQSVIQRNSIILQMQPHNFILKTLVDPIYVEFAIIDRSIISYKGISNIRDNDGSVFEAFLYYPEK